MASPPVRFPGLHRVQMRVFDALSNVSRDSLTNSLKLKAPEGVTTPQGKSFAPLENLVSIPNADAEVINILLTVDFTGWTPSQDGAWSLVASDVSDSSSNKLGKETLVGTIIIDLATGKKNDLKPPTVTVNSIEELSIPTPLTPSIDINFKDGSRTSLPIGWEAGPLANIRYTNEGMIIGQVQDKTYNQSYVSSPNIILSEGQEVVIEYIALAESRTEPDDRNPEGRTENAGHVGLGPINFRNPDAVAWTSHGLLHNGSVSIGSAPGNTNGGDLVQMKILASHGLALCTFSKRVNNAWEPQGYFTTLISEKMLQSTSVILDCVKLPLTITRVAF